MEDGRNGCSRNACAACICLILNAFLICPDIQYPLQRLDKIDICAGRGEFRSVSDCPALAEDIIIGKIGDELDEMSCPRVEEIAVKRVLAVCKSRCRSRKRNNARLHHWRC